MGCVGSLCGWGVGWLRLAQAQAQTRRACIPVDAISVFVATELSL